MSRRDLNLVVRGVVVGGWSWRGREVVSSIGRANRFGHGQRELGRQEQSQELILRGWSRGYLDEQSNAISMDGGGDGQASPNDNGHGLCVTLWRWKIDNRLWQEMNLDHCGWERLGWRDASRIALYSDQLV